MKTQLFICKAVSLALIVSLGLPPPALALRPLNPRNSPPLEQQLRSGIEEVRYGAEAKPENVMRGWGFLPDWVRQGIRSQVEASRALALTQDRPVRYLIVGAGMGRIVLDMKGEFPDVEFVFINKEPILLHPDPQRAVEIFVDETKRQQGRRQGTDVTREQAKRHLELFGRQAVICDVGEGFPADERFTPGSFDGVLIPNQVLKYIFRMPFVLDECKSLLRIGGQAFVFMVGEFALFPHEPLDEFFGGLPQEEYFFEDTWLRIENKVPSGRLPPLRLAASKEERGFPGSPAYRNLYFRVSGSVLEASPDTLPQRASRLVADIPILKNSPPVLVDAGFLRDPGMAAVLKEIGARDGLKERVFLWGQAPPGTQLPVNMKTVTPDSLQEFYSRLRSDSRLSNLSFVGNPGDAELLREAGRGGKPVTVTVWRPPVTGLLCGAGVPLHEACQIALSNGFGASDAGLEDPQGARVAKLQAGLEEPAVAVLMTGGPEEGAVELTFKLRPSMRSKQLGRVAVKALEVLHRQLIAAGFLQDDPDLALIGSLFQASSYELDITRRDRPSNQEAILLSAPVHNAVDAVVTRARRLGKPVEGRIRFDWERTGDALTLRLTDNGDGIPPDVLETFFSGRTISTKKPQVERIQRGSFVGRWADFFSKLIGRKRDPYPWIGGLGASINEGMYGDELLAQFGGLIQIETEHAGTGVHWFHYDPAKQERIVWDGQGDGQTGTRVHWVFPLDSGSLVPRADSEMPSGFLSAVAKAAAVAELSLALEPEKAAGRPLLVLETRRFENSPDLLIILAQFADLPPFRDHVILWGDPLSRQLQRTRLEWAGNPNQLGEILQHRRQQFDIGRVIFLGETSADRIREVVEGQGLEFTQEPPSLLELLAGMVLDRELAGQLAAGIEEALGLGQGA